MSLASDGSHLALAWYGTTPGARESIHLRYLDGKGGPAGPDVRLTDGARQAYEPSLQLLDGDAIVAWYEKDAAGATQAYVGRFSSSGTRRWQTNLSPPHARGRNPVVRTGASGIHVAWLQQRTEEAETLVMHGRLDPDGSWKDVPRDAGRADPGTWNLNAALDPSGTFHLVYDARGRTDAREIQLISIRGAQVQHTQLSADDGFASQFPDLAVDHGRIALTWFDERDGNHEVYLYVGAFPDPGTAIDDKALRITRTAGDSIGAYVAWHDNVVGLAWCDDTTGEYTIFAQQFDERGTPLNRPKPLTDGRLQALVPSIVPWQQGFAVAWNERLALEDGSRHSRTVSSGARVRLVPLAGNRH